MIPVLICVPVLVSGRTGFTCFLPNIVMFLIHTSLLCLLVFVSVLVNVIDTELCLGYLLHSLIVLGTLIFLALGIFGYQRVSARLLLAAFWIFCITWFGYLLITIFSVYNPKTLEATSINGRCPLNFWILDWCKHVHPISDNRTQKAHLDIGKEYKLDYFNLNTTEEQKSVIEDKRYLAHPVSPQADKDKDILQSQNDKDISKSFISNQIPISQVEVSLTDLGGYQIHTSPNNKIVLAYTLGIFLVMVIVMYTYTMYGYILLKVLNQIRNTALFIIARVPGSEQGGQNQNEGTNHTQNDKK